jgi:hypothetical protein
MVLPLLIVNLTADVIIHPFFVIVLLGYTSNFLLQRTIMLR